MLDDIDKEELGLIGFFYQNGFDTKAALLLQSMLKTQLEKEASLSFSEIYDAFSRENEGSKISKAWVHKLLRSLTELRLVAIEAITARRNNYNCDINTLSTGLGFMREQALQHVLQEMKDLKARDAKLKELDTTSLAQKVHESMTGMRKHPTSRFLKGLEEFHRVTDETIYQAAGPGDIIRNSVANVGPFVLG
ncbi:MAG: hypothetical protein ACFFED_11430, partial [Candidatus Thorarchaeota archaeon]